MAEFLDLRRASEEFSLGRRKLQQLIQQKRLPAYRIDRKLLVRPEDLHKLIVPRIHETLNKKEHLQHIADEAVREVLSRGNMPRRSKR